MIEALGRDMAWLSAEQNAKIVHAASGLGLPRPAHKYPHEPYEALHLKTAWRTFSEFTHIIPASSASLKPEGSPDVTRPKVSREAVANAVRVGIHDAGQLLAKIHAETPAGAGGSGRRPRACGSAWTAQESVIMISRNLEGGMHRVGADDGAELTVGNAANSL